MNPEPDLATSSGSLSHRREGHCQWPSGPPCLLADLTSASSALCSHCSATLASLLFLELISYAQTHPRAFAQTVSLCGGSEGGQEGATRGEGKSSGLGLRGPIARTSSELATGPCDLGDYVSPGPSLPICRMVGWVVVTLRLPPSYVQRVSGAMGLEQVQRQPGASPSAFLTSLVPCGFRAGLPTSTASLTGIMCVYIPVGENTVRAYSGSSCPGQGLVCLPPSPQAAGLLEPPQGPPNDSPTL